MKKVEEDKQLIIQQNKSYSKHNNEIVARNINQEQSYRKDLNKENYQRNLNQEQSYRKDLNKENYQRNLNQKQSYRKDLNKENYQRNLNQKQSYRKDLNKLKSNKYLKKIKLFLIQRFLKNQKIKKKIEFLLSFYGVIIKINKKILKLFYNISQKDLYLKIKIILFINKNYFKTKQLKKIAYPIYLPPYNTNWFELKTPEPPIGYNKNVKISNFIWDRSRFNLLKKQRFINSHFIKINNYTKVFLPNKIFCINRLKLKKPLIILTKRYFKYIFKYYFFQFNIFKKKIHLYLQNYNKLNFVNKYLYIYFKWWCYKSTIKININKLLLYTKFQLSYSILNRFYFVYNFVNPDNLYKLNIYDSKIEIIIVYKQYLYSLYINNLNIINKYFITQNCFNGKMYSIYQRYIEYFINFHNNIPTYKYQKKTFVTKYLTLIKNFIYASGHDQFAKSDYIKNFFYLYFKPESKPNILIIRRRKSLFNIKLILRKLFIGLYHQYNLPLFLHRAHYYNIFNAYLIKPYLIHRKKFKIEIKLIINVNC